MNHVTPVQNDLVTYPVLWAGSWQNWRASFSRQWKVGRPFVRLGRTCCLSKIGHCTTAVTNSLGAGTVGYWHTTRPDSTLCLLAPRLLRQVQTSDGRRKKLFELGYPRNAVTLLGPPAPNAFSHRYQGWPSLALAMCFGSAFVTWTPTNPSERLARRRGGPFRHTRAWEAGADSASRASGGLSQCLLSRRPAQGMWEKTPRGGPRGGGETAIMPVVGSPLTAHTGASRPHCGRRWDFAF